MLGAPIKAGEKTIYLIRHGETEGNIRCQSLTRCFEGLLCCRCPPPEGRGAAVRSCASILCCNCDLRNPALSEAGRRQAADVGRHFRATGFVEATQTELVVHSNLDRTRRTCEVLFDGTGVPREELSVFREWYVTDWLCCPADGHFRTRVRKCLQYLAARPEHVIAVVGHGMLFYAMQGPGAQHFGNVEVRRCTLDTAGLTLTHGDLLYRPCIPPTWEQWGEDERDRSVQ